MNQNSEKLSEEFKAEVDRLNERFFAKMNKVCGKLSESVKTLRRDTQQQIKSVSERIENVTESMNEKIGHATESLNERIVRVTEIVNDKIDQLSEFVNERLALHLSEAKKGQEMLGKELENNARDILANELASSRQGVTDENSNTVQESAQAARRSSDSRIVEISSQLDRIQKQIAAVSSSQTVNQSTVWDSMELGVCSRSVGQRSTSTPAENFGNLQKSERMTDKCAFGFSSHSDHSDHSDNVPVVSVAIVLPKFHGCRKQNVVQFLAELGDYYRLNRVIGLHCL
jgi:hypothetical protein